MKLAAGLIAGAALLGSASACGESTAERGNAPPVPGENITPSPHHHEMSPQPSGVGDQGDPNAPRTGSGPDPTG